MAPQAVGGRSKFPDAGTVLVLLLSLAHLTAPLVAQETTGSISGIVLDKSGAAIPGASIAVKGNNLPSPIAGTSDTHGSYFLPSVPPGRYFMIASAAGFESLQQISVHVVLGRTTRLDFTLRIGSISESVTVIAEAATVDTASSASSVDIDRSFFELLPRGRSFFDLTELAPGARNEAKSGGFQVDGASGAESVYYLDGMEITNIQTGVLTSQNRIPVEAIQQIQIKNGVMEAQYGGAMGGVVNAVVRRGTDGFHGQAGFYFDNDSMSARPRPSLRISPFDQNIGEYFQNPMDDHAAWNPVASWGGPILKERLFFFSGYMPLRTTTKRTVMFNTGESGDYISTVMQHYWIHRLDFVPAPRWTMWGSWVWNPVKKTGVLPAGGGTDAYDAPWGQEGDYTAGNILSGQINYIPSGRMVASLHGGYHFTNYSNNYGIPNNTAIRFVTSTLTIPGLPDDLRRPAGWVSQSVARTDYDTFRRININADVDYLLGWHGQHNLKAGWQMNHLSNSLFSSSFPDGVYAYFWNLSYRCITTQCTGQQRGTWGYYAYRFNALTGDASGDNMGLFVQDAWTVNRHLTLNLGMRTEREFVPSFAASSQIPSKAIELSWGQKLSPRFGFAFDPRGDGRMKIYSSWGYCYDVMKYELPRGLFGGNNNIIYYYTLEDYNLPNELRGIPADPNALPGTLLESINGFLPANDPSGNWIDPNLRPMKQSTFDMGYDYNLRPTLVLSLRYTRRRLVYTIEDIGTIGPLGESYRIGNPGFGVVADPAAWDLGIPATPKARRDYDALETRLERRFARKYQFALSYTYSRLYGNYSGLASSDENGRTSPNVNRYFDMPWLGYTEKGGFSEGRLATDRPHTLKLFAAYTMASPLGDTTFSPTVAWFSGTPLTTDVGITGGAPAYVYGRGDLGRTPAVFQSNANFMHDFRPFKRNEGLKLRFECTIFNLFNSATEVNRNVALIHPADGYIQFDNTADFFKGFDTIALMQQQNIRRNPIYNLPSAFLGPRSLRIQISLLF